MSWTRRFIWTFWICLGVLLCWNLYSCNDKIAQEAAQPKQDHFFFYQPTKETAAAAAVPAGPRVEQTGFQVEDNTPTNGAFTCHVTLKNTGKSKAIDVQVCVRPYRGSDAGNEDSGPNVSAPIPDDDPRAQVNQWVSFPDLDAGASSTQSVVFTKEKDATNFGNNPKAEIVFRPEKKQ
jgi:hypothetical protein